MVETDKTLTLLQAKHSTGMSMCLHVYMLCVIKYEGTYRVLYQLARAKQVSWSFITYYTLHMTSSYFDQPAFLPSVPGHRRADV